MSVDSNKISVRLTSNVDEIKAAQALRYKVFYEEFGAQPTNVMQRESRDFDVFDDAAVHMIVVRRDDRGSEEIIGTYRMLTPEGRKQIGRYYSASEYDLAPLVSSGKKLLELGRSCVLKPYRTRPVMQLLWQGIADYVLNNDIDIMFGCASFNGIDIENHKTGLAYLHHFHSAPQAISPSALHEHYVDMNFMPKVEINERRAFASLPPLIKGYLRLGATIGNGAVIDEQFNMVDVCIIVQTETVSARYKKHYERKTQIVDKASHKGAA